MNIDILETKEELGKKAANMGASLIREAILYNGQASIIVATGASQFEMLAHLVKQEGIDWSRVRAFHLDEYIGLPMTHPASFRKYLKERFVDLTSLREFNYIDGEANTKAECERLGKLINEQEVDVAFVGIGENAHLAFNDPPADFEIDNPYILVNLDEACRKQQLGEGWFLTFDEVPSQAISMSIKQIMKSKTIICSVPDKRKALAVKNTIEGDISVNIPASILQAHEKVWMYLDVESASLLRLKA